jgi:sec-independent protein translocase protein TatA
MGFSGLGMWEILLIFLVVLLLFGAKRLPEIGSSLGKGIREFKGSIRELESEIKTPEDRRLDEGRPREPELKRDHRDHEGARDRSGEENGEASKLTSR